MNVIRYISRGAARILGTRPCVCPYMSELYLLGQAIQNIITDAYAPFICCSDRMGQGIDGRFNFSVCKVLHCGGQILLKVPVPRELTNIKNNK